MILTVYSLPHRRPFVYVKVSYWDFGYIWTAELLF